MKKMANALELGKQSWNALRQNPQLMIFPLISGIGVLIITILFFVPFVGVAISSGGDSDSLNIVGIVVMFLYYFVIYTVIIYSNTALVAVSLKLIRGEPATVQDGLKLASERMGKIVVYALISATVGMIARGIAQSSRESDNIVIAIIGSIIGGLIQGAWNLVVFFAIPVLVVEDTGVIESMKRSFDIFKRTWGESFIGSTAISAFSCLVYLGLFGITALVVGAGIALQSVFVIGIGGVFFIIGIAALSLINGAINGVFQASLYQYATTGDAGAFIDTALAREAFGHGAA